MMGRPQFEAEIMEEFAKGRGGLSRLMEACGASSAKERDRELARAMAQTELITVTGALSEMVYGFKTSGPSEKLQELGNAAVTASGWMAAQAALYAMGARRSVPLWTELAESAIEKSPREVQLEKLVESCRVGGVLIGEDRRVADFAGMLGRWVKYASLPWPPEVEQLDACVQKQELPEARASRL